MYISFISLFIFVVILGSVRAESREEYTGSHISRDSSLRFQDRDVGVFWHITDPHIDLEYEVGTPSICNVPLCCRVNTTQPNRESLTFRGRTYSNRDLYGKVIESKTALPLATLGTDCDIDHNIWISALKWIHDSFSKDKPDFIVAGGDWIHHADWMQVPEDYLRYAKLITDDFHAEFGKELPIYPIIGNHDGSNAVNIMPYHSETKEKLLQYLDQLWGSAWLKDPEARKTLREWGYYSELIPASLESGRQKIRIVSLNSQWVNPLNFWVYSSKTDLSLSLEWVGQVFNQSRANGEKVLISGHIPPGISRGSASPESLNFWNEGFEKLLVEYGDIVIGGICGHTHQDDFGIFHDYSENPPRPTMVTFTSPALTPYGGSYYPTLRKFYYDRNTGELLDHETYYNNVTAFHQKGGEFNDYWKLEYSAKEAWGLKDLSPSEIQTKIYDRLWNNDKSAWDKFGDFHNVLSSHPCGNDNVCKRKFLCSMGHMNLFNYATCVTSPWPRSH